MSFRTSTDLGLTRGRVLEDPRSIGAPARPPTAAAAPSVARAKTVGAAAPAFADLSAARTAETKERASIFSSMSPKIAVAAAAPAASAPADSADSGRSIAIVRDMLMANWNTQYFLPTITPLSYEEIRHLTVREVVQFCSFNLVGIVLLSRKIEIVDLIKWFKWDDLIRLDDLDVKTKIFKVIQMILKKPAETGYPDNDLLMESIKNCINLFCLFNTAEFSGYWDQPIDNQASEMPSFRPKLQKLFDALELKLTPYNKALGHQFVRSAHEMYKFFGDFALKIGRMSGRFEVVEAHRSWISQLNHLNRENGKIHIAIQLLAAFFAKVGEDFKKGVVKASSYYEILSIRSLVSQETENFFKHVTAVKELEQCYLGVPVKPGDKVDLMFNRLSLGIHHVVMDFLQQISTDPTLQALAYPFYELFDQHTERKTKEFCEVLDVIIQEIIDHLDNRLIAEFNERLIVNYTNSICVNDPYPDTTTTPDINRVLTDFDCLIYDTCCLKAEAAINRFIATYDCTIHEKKYIDLMKRKFFAAVKLLGKRVFNLSKHALGNLSLSEESREVLPLTQVRITYSMVQQMVTQPHRDKAPISFTSCLQRHLEQVARPKKINDPDDYQSQSVIKASLFVFGKETSIRKKATPDLLPYIPKPDHLEPIENMIRFFVLLNQAYSCLLLYVSIPHEPVGKLVEAAHAAAMKIHKMKDRLDMLKDLWDTDRTFEAETKAKTAIETIRPRNFPKPKTTPKGNKNKSVSKGAALSPAELINGITKKIFLLFGIDSLQQLTELRGEVNLQLADSLLALDHLKRVMLNALKINQPDANQDLHHKVALIGATVLDRMLGYQILLKTKTPNVDLSHNLLVQGTKAGVDLQPTVWATRYRRVIVLSRYLYVYHRNGLKNKDLEPSKGNTLLAYVDLIHCVTKSLVFNYPDICPSLNEVNKLNALLFAKIRVLSAPARIAEEAPILVAPDFFYPHAFKVEASLNQLIMLTATIEAERKAARAQYKKIPKGDPAIRTLVDEGVQLRLTRGRLKSMEHLLRERQLSSPLTFALASGPESWHQFFHSLLYSTHFIVENCAVIFGNKCRKTVPNHNMTFVLKAGFGEGLDADVRETLLLVAELGNAELFPMQYAERFRKEKKPNPLLLELNLNLQFCAEHLAKGGVRSRFVGYGNKPVHVELLKSNFMKYSIDLINLTHAMMMKELPRILALKG